MHRLPAPTTHFPEAVYWGESVSDVASAMGKELRELGFNLSYARCWTLHWRRRTE